MGNVTTTIRLEEDLYHYIKTNNINLTRFVRNCLLEHSGKQDSDEVKIVELSAEIKELELNLSIKKGILAQIKEKMAEKEQEMAEKREKKPDLSQDSRNFCKNCTNFIGKSDIANNEEHYRYGYCKECWIGGGVVGEGFMREVLQNAKKH